MSVLPRQIVVDSIACGTPFVIYHVVIVKGSKKWCEHCSIKLTPPRKMYPLTFMCKKQCSILRALMFIYIVFTFVTFSTAVITAYSIKAFTDNVVCLGGYNERCGICTMDSVTQFMELVFSHYNH